MCEDNDTLSDTDYDRLREQSYIEACERQGPNSVGFDSLRDGIFERLSIELLRVYKVTGRPHES